MQRLCKGVSTGELIKKALGLGADGDEDIVDETEQAAAVDQILEKVAAAPPVRWEESQWRDFLDALSRQPVVPRNEVPRLPRRTDNPDLVSDELDEVSLAPAAVHLDLHCQAVGVRAGAIAKRLGLASDLIELVERAGSPTCRPSRG